MPSPKIIAHCLVKNEERFIWYSLNSVLPYVDKIMVWDTGSTDKTVRIISSIGRSALGRKIILKEVGTVDADSFTVMRQKMIEATPNQYTWIMVLDGDEIWPMKAIKKVTDFAKVYPEYESIVVRTRNMVGDIYHRLPESAGKYHLAGRVGHLSLRFMNVKKIKGLRADLPHGQFGYFDEANKLIQDRKPSKIKFIDTYYYHATHLKRSSADGGTIKRPFKYKFELGTKNQSAELPSVFFKSHPKIVPDVTGKMPLSYCLKSVVMTPLRRLKRFVIPGRHGY